MTFSPNLNFAELHFQNLLVLEEMPEDLPIPVSSDYLELSDYEKHIHDRRVSAYVQTFMSAIEKEHSYINEEMDLVNTELQLMNVRLQRLDLDTKNYKFYAVRMYELYENVSETIRVNVVALFVFVQDMKNQVVDYIETSLDLGFMSFYRV